MGLRRASSLRPKQPVQTPARRAASGSDSGISRDTCSRPNRSLGLDLSEARSSAPARSAGGRGDCRQDREDFARAAAAS